jgi:hypothetical protein
VVQRNRGENGDAVEFCEWNFGSGADEDDQDRELAAMEAEN